MVTPLVEISRRNLWWLEALTRSVWRIGVEIWGCSCEALGLCRLRVFSPALEMETVANPVNWSGRVEADDTATLFVCKDARMPIYRRRLAGYIPRVWAFIKCSVVAQVGWSMLMFGLKNQINGNQEVSGSSLEAASRGQRRQWNLNGASTFCKIRQIFGPENNHTHKSSRKYYKKRSEHRSPCERNKRPNQKIQGKGKQKSRSFFFSFRMIAVTKSPKVHWWRGARSS